MSSLLFPYRNDPRKILIPYLEALDEQSWFKKSDVYHNSIAWIIAHISCSEDYWINKIWLKDSCLLNLNEHSTAKELLESYIYIRNYTDDILH
ncbi:DinB family protein [Bacillus sp. JJ722]|uniref:DinB family protein n=1 Tax=Bacillus sp. JJ722 TaxID=3122973 RepID=UPI003000BF4F